jgi:hypothetical protein
MNEATLNFPSQLFVAPAMDRRAALQAFVQGVHCESGGLRQLLLVHGVTGAVEVGRDSIRDLLPQ